MNNSPTKTLSICIVGINAKEYLVKCLESIEGISFSNKHEIIYVDNGSTDGSIDLIKEKYKNEFPAKTNF